MKKLKQLKKIKNECRKYDVKLRKGNYVEAELLGFVLESLIIMVNVLLQAKYQGMEEKKAQKEP